MTPWIFLWLNHFLQSASFPDLFGKPSKLACFSPDLGSVKAADLPGGIPDMVTVLCPANEAAGTQMWEVGSCIPISLFNHLKQRRAGPSPTRHASHLHLNWISWSITCCLKETTMLPFISMFFLDLVCSALFKDLLLLLWYINTAPPCCVHILQSYARLLRWLIFPLPQGFRFVA